MKSASAQRAAARGSKDLLLTLMATGRAGIAVGTDTPLPRACTQLSHEIVAGIRGGTGCGTSMPCPSALGRRAAILCSIL